MNEFAKKILIMLSGYAIILLMYRKTMKDINKIYAESEKEDDQNVE